jgi:hypothetical protein
VTPHGTRTRYFFYGCRCKRCRKAGREYQRDLRDRLKTQPIPHGTVNGYQNYGCRCEDCCKAASAKRREQRANKRKRAA